MTMKPDRQFVTWADRVDAAAARRVLRGHAAPTQEELRDWADSVSGQELDCVALDILCDMVDRRIARWLKEPAKG
jgi:hypothetical protein